MLLLISISFWQLLTIRPFFWNEDFREKNLETNCADDEDGFVDGEKASRGYSQKSMCLKFSPFLRPPKKVKKLLRVAAKNFSRPVGEYHKKSRPKKIPSVSHIREILPRQPPFFSPVGGVRWKLDKLPSLRRQEEARSPVVVELLLFLTDLSLPESNLFYWMATSLLYISSFPPPPSKIHFVPRATMINRLIMAHTPSARQYTSMRERGKGLGKYSSLISLLHLSLLCLGVRESDDRVAHLVSYMNKTWKLTIDKG